MHDVHFGLSLCRALLLAMQRPAQRPMPSQRHQCGLFTYAPPRALHNAECREQCTVHARGCVCTVHARRAVTAHRVMVHTSGRVDRASDTALPDARPYKRKCI